MVSHFFQRTSLVTNLSKANAVRQQKAFNTTAGPLNDMHQLVEIQAFACRLCIAYKVRVLERDTSKILLL
jgi:hypothetical protein